MTNVAIAKAPFCKFQHHLGRDISSLLFTHPRLKVYEAGNVRLDAGRSGANLGLKFAGTANTYHCLQLSSRQVKNGQNKEAP